MCVASVVESHEKPFVVDGFWQMSYDDANPCPDCNRPSQCVT